MKYILSEKTPRNKVLWGCAYNTNNTEKGMMYNRKPVQGKIIEEGKYGYDVFYELKKDGNLKKNGTSEYSRVYADTYDECVELYNELVNNQIRFLKKLINDCEKDLIINI